ncbi:unnamed protein product [Cunninghamella blakesleeana]
MDELPIEILVQIFKYTSQRNITHYSSVCKKWKHIITSQPTVFYSTIKLYSLRQVRKFIKKAKEPVVIVTTTNNITQIINKSFGHYVQHIYLCCDYQSFPLLIRDLMLVLPNIQSIHSTKSENNYDALHFLKSSIHLSVQLPLLDHLSHIPFWYIKSHKRNWLPTTTTTTISTNRDHKHPIKSINYRFPSKDEEYDIFPFHFKKVGFKKSIESVYLHASLMNHHQYYFEEGNDDIRLDNFDYQSKILKLSTLDNTTTGNNNNRNPFYYLTDLTITFSKSQSGSDIFELDERTLESIHQSCPQLSTLQLYYFFMNLSEEYPNLITNNINNIKNNNNDKMLPSLHLKQFKMYGFLMDPKCYTYLSLKYPKLESFELITQNISYLKDQSKMFQSCIFNMLTHYPLLKRLYVDILCDQHWNSVFWPHHEFLQWLVNHPDQLDYLYYPYHLEPNIFLQQQQQMIEKRKEKIEMDSKTDLQHPITLPLNHHYKIYLNYLTSFTINYTNLIDIAIEYFLFHSSTTPISQSIKELKIIGSSFHVGKCNSLFFMYDWLDVFPNVTTLILYQLFIRGEHHDPKEEEIEEKFHFMNLNHNHYINNNNNGNNNGIDDNYGKKKISKQLLQKYNGKIPCGIYLHHLIKQRKKKQKDNDEHHHHHHKKKYPLKRLEIIGSRFYLKNKDGNKTTNGNENGFDSLLNEEKLPFIKWINFSNVYYAYIGLDDEKHKFRPTIILKELSINLPCSTLDYFAINNFRIIPWNEKCHVPSSNLVVTKIIMSNNKYNNDISHTYYDDNIVPTPPPSSSSSSLSSQQEYTIHHDKTRGFEHGSIHYIVQIKSYGLRLNCQYVDEVLFYNNYLKKI